MGECTNSREFMRTECPATCGLCGECLDKEPEKCIMWAQHDECNLHPAYMHQNCPRSCRICGDRRTLPPELDDLEDPWDGTAVLDVTPAELDDLTAQSPLVITWFYAPWCKQCKLVRGGFEDAAVSAREHGIPFARIDVTKYEDVKKAQQITSYPSFKALRGEHSRWLEVGKNRSAENLLRAALDEQRGPFDVVGDGSQLAERMQPTENPSEVQGHGEALSVAVLSSSAAEKAYTRLAAGCSARNSPLPFVALRVEGGDAEGGADAPKLSAAELEEAFDGAGLPPIPPDHIGVVQMFDEEGSPPPPRLVIAPLVPGATAPAAGGRAGGAAAAVNVTHESDVVSCTWALATRLPAVMDYDENPWWAKRASSFGFVTMHALLFLSPPHHHLAEELRRAAARYHKGTLITMKFMISEEIDPNDPNLMAMIPRFGVKSILDTPRLVFLDQRLQGKANANRHLVFDGGLISEQNVVYYLAKHGIAERAILERAKDEL